MSNTISPILLPKQVELYPCFPNPASRSMTIRYALPRSANIMLSVYDIAGKQVKTLVNRQTSKPGYYNANWNLTDQRNRKLAGGVYFCRLSVSGATNGQKDETRTRKAVISR